MKILLIGGTGTIGKRVTSHFQKNHEVITAGRKHGNILVEITDSKSILNMFEKHGKVDALISIAGEAKWAGLNDLTEEDYHIDHW